MRDLLCVDRHGQRADGDPVWIAGPARTKRPGLPGPLRVRWLYGAGTSAKFWVALAAVRSIGTDWVT